MFLLCEGGKLAFLCSIRFGVHMTLKPFTTTPILVLSSAHYLWKWKGEAVIFSRRASSTMRSACPSHAIRSCNHAFFFCRYGLRDLKRSSLCALPLTQACTMVRIPCRVKLDGSMDIPLVFCSINRFEYTSNNHHHSSPCAFRCPSPQLADAKRMQQGKSSYRE